MDTVVLTPPTIVQIIVLTFSRTKWFNLSMPHACRGVFTCMLHLRIFAKRKEHTKDLHNREALG